MAAGGPCPARHSSRQLLVPAQPPAILFFAIYTAFRCDLAPLSLSTRQLTLLLLVTMTGSAPPPAERSTVRLCCGVAEAISQH